MSLNKGKPKRVKYTFLGKEYTIFPLPCGVEIPFNVELEKVRHNAIEIVNNIDPKTPSSKVFEVLGKYYSDHPEEAHKHMMQMVKAVSVITEFFTDGEVDEKYIQKRALEEEVGDFINKIEHARQEETLKKLKMIRKNLQSTNSKSEK